MDEFKYIKRVSYNEVEWVAKVPKSTSYLNDKNVIEISQEEYLFLLHQKDDFDDNI